MGQNEFWYEKLRPPKNWVKIGSGTTELFMIWKKVVRTNIACTNVTVNLLIVKIGSVSAEIFLIWTNVARTNIAYTNVTVTVKICSRWSQEPICTVWSKLCQ